MAAYADGVAFGKTHFAAGVVGIEVDDGVVQHRNAALLVAHNDAVGNNGLCVGSVGAGGQFVIIGTPLLAIKLAHGDGAPIEVGLVGGVAPVESGVESQLVALHQIADAARLHGVGQAGLGLAGFGRLRDTP